MKADFTFHWVYFYITNSHWGMWSIKKGITLKVFYKWLSEGSGPY